ncbi:MAG: isoprenylcysteine carboxylmethyltransferase family protein [Xanthomonadales bacterium]|nr:isoprenylcysteine carboxylmethyltransferase family protein [Xanthomonadales bacterium]
MHRLLPPPAALFLAGLLAWLLARAFPAWQVVLPGQQGVALALAVAGSSLMLAAALSLLAARTTLNPLHPERASTLIAVGAFALSRNPIYLGDALLLCAWLVWLGQPLGLLALAGFVLWLDRAQIPAEERALAQRFGADWQAYRARVRRWL